VGWCVALDHGWATQLFPPILLFFFLGPLPSEARAMMAPVPALEWP